MVPVILWKPPYFPGDEASATVDHPSSLQNCHPCLVLGNAFFLDVGLNLQFRILGVGIWASEACRSGSAAGANVSSTLDLALRETVSSPVCLEH